MSINEALGIGKNVKKIVKVQRICDSSSFNVILMIFGSSRRFVGFNNASDLCLAIPSRFPCAGFYRNVQIPTRVFFQGFFESFVLLGQRSKFLAIFWH